MLDKLVKFILPCLQITDLLIPKRGRSNPLSGLIVKGLLREFDLEP